MAHIFNFRPMAFRFLKNDIKFPPIYPNVERKDPTVNDKGWDKVGGFMLRDKIDFMPQKGLQERFVSCDSNLIFLCGESQMGKTYGMFLKALNGVGLLGYTARFISVRLQDSKKGGSIFRDAVEVCGNFANCQYNASDYPTFVWPQWNNAMQLIHSNFNTNNPSEWADFKEYAKKNQASYICVDEATDMRDFKMFSYWFSRNRDSSGMTPQMVLSFNFEHEHFTTTMLKDAGYIGDDWYFKHEMNGVTRYFYVKGDNENGIIWGETPEDVADRAEIHITEKERIAGVTIHQIVKSFTAFTGESADNLKLIAATGGQNIGNLHNTGATSRSILKQGYAGPVDKEEANVNRQMIHNLWENPIADDENMYATMDISSGKSENDKCPMIIWRGLQMINIEQFSGNPNELAGWIQSRLDKYNVAIKNFAFDATGHGYWVQAFTAGIPITWNKRVMQEYDANGNSVTTDEYFNLRSQLLGKTEVLVKSCQMSCAIPKDKLISYGHKNEQRRFVDILFDEIKLFSTLKKNGKTYYRSTDEFKSKFRFSPDIMTTIAIRSVFELDTRERKQPKLQVPDNAYNGLYNGYHGGWGSRRQTFYRRW